MPIRLIVWLLLAFLPACHGCQKKRSAPTRTITVFAAASLTESFTELAKQFENRYPRARVQVNFAGSQQLRAQIEQGAHADVFAPASKSEMDGLVKNGLVAADSPRIFARNKLVVVVSRKHPAGIESLGDLARPGLKLILGDLAVPVGRYTEEMLSRASAPEYEGSGFKDRVMGNVLSREKDVKWVLAKVRLGEADAGVVYASDVTPQARQDAIAIPIPDAVNPTAEYPIAPLSASTEPDLARQFVDFVLSAEGQATLSQFGFAPATAASHGNFIQ